MDFRLQHSLGSSAPQKCSFLPYLLAIIMMSSIIAFAWIKPSPVSLIVQEDRSLLFSNNSQTPLELSDLQPFQTGHHRLQISNDIDIRRGHHNQPSDDLTFFKQNFTLRHPSRVRRGIVQLASMIKCVSGCKPIQYKGYGCFCGLFGSGKPVDAIDRCCLKHDWCYSNAPCHQLLLYIAPYNWECAAPGYASCSRPDYVRRKDKCGFSLCECDRVFAECISQYPCPSYKAPCPYKQMVLAVVGK